MSETFQWQLKKSNKYILECACLYVLWQRLTYLITYIQSEPILTVEMPGFYFFKLINIDHLKRMEKFRKIINF